MTVVAARWRRTPLEQALIWCALMLVAALMLPAESQALPLFARQTGQNCLACHAGGQFPELTPYGRKFKLTGYTMGERAALPLAFMAVASMAKANDTSSGGFETTPDPYRNGQVDLTTASIFCCGKLTDNLGLFGQWTYDRFDHTNDQGNWVGKGHVDQVDLRYADRFIDQHRDLIVGLSLNNNPGVSDVWNTHNSAFAAVPTYVPLSNAMFAANSPIPSDVAAVPFIQSEGQAAAGLTTYAFLNNTIYAEAGLYKTAEGAFSIFNESNLGEMEYPTRIKGYNPYWRLALNHDWGANSAMIGLHGMNAGSYSDPTDTSSPVVDFQDTGVDGQYQYILDPHVVTAIFSWTHERQSYPSPLVGALTDNSSDTLEYFRAKGTYVYEAKYGASLAYTSVTGSTDATLYGSSPSGRPNSQLWVPEIFWNPVQYVRVGLQYYDWIEYNGSRSNVTNNTDPTVTNRSAADNNTLLLYVWAAY